MTFLVLLMLIALAAANGSNDVPKGVATLAGAGVTHYRTAIAWGTVTTLAGSLVSLHFADRLTKLFSTGIFTGEPTAAFALAVLVGAAAWVGVATATKLPVSTTHAIVGSLIGAGLVLGAGAVDFGAFPQRVVVPLALSIGLAYVVSVRLNLLPRRLPECVCVGLSEGTQVQVAGPNGTALMSSAVTLPLSAEITTGSVAECAVHTEGARRVGLSVNGAHWLSSGATSFARGLNDTPKMVAIGAFALVPAGLATSHVLLVVAGSMAVGSVLGGMRIARRLGEGIVRMSHVEGFKANVTTALLVGLAAHRGLPLSTTHVSTGAIAGAAGRRVSRLNAGTLRDFAIAWTVTPLTAGLIAAGALALLG